METFDVFKRDRFTCQYCGAHPPAVVLHVDHVIPVVDGGSNHPANLLTACSGCNLGNGPRQIGEIPDSFKVSIKEKARELAEREAQLRGYHELIEAQRQRVEDESWSVAVLFMDSFGDASIRKDWLRSIKTFVEKLGVHECKDAMEMAAYSSRPRTQHEAFRYFCGICWGKIRENERGAS